MIFQVTNEALTAIIVIVSASMLLYNLTRNRHSPVAISSSILLACVTVSYVADGFTVLDPTPGPLEGWLRIQWLAIAFAPAAMFHLSDALLATTGMVSRGRRRRVVRILYVFSLLFFIMAAFSDVLVYGLITEPAPHMLPGPMFWVYTVFVILATIVSVYNVVRARHRCLTTYTYRRMSYLLFSFATPALGIFPYSSLFMESDSSAALFWLLVNVGNLGIALMLLFMAYPLYFFGSNIPDRVIKSELLEFFLRGPATGILVLFIIVYIPSNHLFLGVSGGEIKPFVAVGSVMFWQWMVSLTLPILERRLAYTNDKDQMRMIQSISRRLLTRHDLHQLLESILAGVCDLLQVRSSFVAVFEADQIQVEEAVGTSPNVQGWPTAAEMKQVLQAAPENGVDIIHWESYWLVPLYSRRVKENGMNGSNGKSAARLLGFLGIYTNQQPPDIADEEEFESFELLVRQAAQVLDDRLLQTEVFAALEGLLPEMDALQRLRDAARYGDIDRFRLFSPDSGGPSSEDEAFINAVRDALRDYWGGPRLTQSELTHLKTVQDALAEHDNNSTRALRAVLLEAVNRLKPPGERAMTRTEWTLYNIIELRFVQGLKVRDVARRLAMSEADLYRKQRTAIEEVARVLGEMELNTHEADTLHTP